MESKANELKAIQFLYKLLLVCPLLFAAIMIFLIESGLVSPAISRVGNIFLVVATILSVGCVANGYVLFRKRIEAIKQQNELSAKLEGYRAALILQLALAEGPALFAVIAYFITGNHAFWIIIALLIANFLNLYPSKDKMVRQLELNSEEEAILE